MGTDIQDQQMSLTNYSGIRVACNPDENPGKQMLVEL